MNGIKNYLVKHGEGELEDLIERERSKVGFPAGSTLMLDLALTDSLCFSGLPPLIGLFNTTKSRSHLAHGFEVKEVYVVCAKSI